MILVSLIIGVLNIFVAGLYLGILVADKAADRKIEKRNWIFSLLPLSMGIYVVVDLMGKISLL
jgi:hypothetical protein